MRPLSPQTARPACASRPLALMSSGMVRMPVLRRSRVAEAASALPIAWHTQYGRLLRVACCLAHHIPAFSCSGSGSCPSMESFPWRAKVSRLPASAPRSAQAVKTKVGGGRDSIATHFVSWRGARIGLSVFRSSIEARLPDCRLRTRAGRQKHRCQGRQSQIADLGAVCRQGARAVHADAGAYAGPGGRAPEAHAGGGGRLRCRQRPGPLPPRSKSYLLAR